MALSKMFIEDDDEDGNAPSPEVPRTDPAGLINKVKNHLRTYYEPVFNPKDATLHFTTEEVYKQLQKLIPSCDYNSEDVAVWLHEAGFTFYDFGAMRFEWIMKKV